MPKKRDDPSIPWWTRRWLSVMDAADPLQKGRISRGRTYARQGLVRHLAMHPGRISAQVQGSMYQPYQIRIGISPLSDTVWQRVIEALSGQAAHVARLLSGVMPEHIEDIFAAAGGHLIPLSPREFVTDCTCLDWDRPCKHIAAVLFAVGAQIETDPFLLFTLRGRACEQVLHSIQQCWSGNVGATMPAPSPPPALSAMGTASLRPTRFFEAGTELDDFNVTIASPDIQAALLQRLGKPPFATDLEDPFTPLATAYAAVTRRAVQAAERSGERKRKAKPTV
jgi:uncharacterized Zn finger protein